MAWDGATWTAQCTSPECLATAPKGQPAAVTYDTARSRLQILVQNASFPYNQFYEWDGVRYALPPPCAGEGCGLLPSMDLGCINTMVYDPAQRRTVLFATENILSPRTYAWTEAAGWLKQQVTGTPSSRSQAAMIYDGARGRMMLYGGHGTLGAGLSAETWTLRSVGGACTTDAQCGAQHCIDGECCEAACGACERCDARSHTTCTTVRNAETKACGGASACDENAACRLRAGRACSAGSDCQSGFCADGVCCDSTCGDACSVCAAAHGAPADGTCGPAPAGAPGTPACGAYTCNGAQLSCPAACAADADCASGFTCDASHRCVLRVTCEGSSLRVGNDETVSCGTYVCEPRGTCKTTCESVADCTEPFVCDAAGRCVPAPDGEPATDGGGEVSCDAGGAPVHENGVVIAVAAGAGIVTARRRRPRVDPAQPGSP
jgi:hypothetical protein